MPIHRNGELLEKTSVAFCVRIQRVLQFFANVQLGSHSPSLTRSARGFRSVRCNCMRSLVGCRRQRAAFIRAALGDAETLRETPNRRRNARAFFKEYTELILARQLHNKLVHAMRSVRGFSSSAAMGGLLWASQLHSHSREV